MRKKDIIFGSLLLLVCVALLIETGKFYLPPTMRAAPPSLWPRIILILLIAMLVVLIIRSFLQKNAGEGDGRKIPLFSKLTKETKRVILAITATLLFLFLFKPVGFIFSVIVYFLVITQILEPTKSAKTLAIRVAQAVALTVFIFFVFGKGLSVQLPPGILPAEWMR